MTPSRARALGVPAGSPVVVQIERIDASGAGQPVAIRVSDALLDSYYGADYASRVRWIAVEPTAAGRPRTRMLVQTRDIADAATVVTPEVSRQPLVVAAVSGPVSSTGAGNFAAQPLRPTSLWQPTTQTGDFTWSDPLTTPPAAAGPSPGLALAYDAQSIDAETGSTNNQTSDVGEGWSLAGANSITRVYEPCATSDRSGARIAGSGELCFGNDNATITLAGRSSPLVRSGDGSWHLEDDDNTRVEYLTASNRNGTWDGDYWKLTTTDGTQYFFGRNELPGYATGDPVTNSADIVPVCGTLSTRCSGRAGHESPMHYEASQWHLDYVLDTHDNAEAYYYSAQTGRYAMNGVGSKTYDRAANLVRIDYGIADNAPYSINAASDRVILGYGPRCLAGEPREPSSACNPARPTTSYWPDVPWDLDCTSSTHCLQRSPTFWSDTVLSSVTTQFRSSGGSFATVDRWTLTHSWPSPGDGTKAATWLAKISRAAGTGAGAITTPPIVLSGATRQNRVDATNGLVRLDKYRITGIALDSGADLSVTYSTARCSSPHQAPQSNTGRCFPAWWTPPTQGKTRHAAVLDWFNSYVVTQVSSNPENGGPDDRSTDTQYVYSGAPAWKFDTAQATPDADRTWSTWAGYAEVEVRSGDPSAPGQQHTTDYRYFRGLDGDADGTSSDPTRALRSVPDLVSRDGSHAAPDLEPYAGRVFEQLVRNGSSGGNALSTTPIVSDVVTVPYQFGATGSSHYSYRYTDPAAPAATYSASFTDSSYFSGDYLDERSAPLSSGGTRYAVTINTYDGGTGLSSSVSRHTFDSSTRFGSKGTGTISGSVETCQTPTYTVANASAWIIGAVARTLTVSAPCASSVAYPASTSVGRAQVVSDTATYYDGSTTLGAAPTRGDATQSLTAIGYSGPTPIWRVVATRGYDSMGRIITQTDPNAPGGNATTTTAYTPTAGGPLTGTAVTTWTSADPAGWTTTTAIDPSRGRSTSVTDQNGQITTTTYDALGRTSRIWEPIHPRSEYPSSPSSYYQYNFATPLHATKLTVLMPGGDTTSSYALYDGLGRIRQTQAPSEGGGILITDYSYDPNGQLSVQSAPYYATGWPSTRLVTPTVTLPSRTETTYDGAGRITASILLAGNKEAWRTTTRYPGVDRTDVVPPAGGTPTSTFTDPQGETSRVARYESSGISGSDVATSYGYDAAGERTDMTDAAGNSWSWTYNVLGQQIAENDPDTGGTVSTYDADGNRVQTVDNAGHVIDITYDGLDRQTGRYSVTNTDDPPTAGVQLASWTYDRSTVNGTSSLDLGELSSATSYVGGTAGQPGSGTAYTEATAAYDGAGDPLSTSVTVGGTTPLAGTYTTDYTWADDGSPGARSDPAEGGLPSESIQVGYDGDGNPAGLGSGNSLYVASVDYTHLGQVAQVDQINNATVSQIDSYDPASGRLTERQALRLATADAVVADDSYSYSNDGQILEDDNATPGTGTDTQCYAYSDLGDLTQAWTPADHSCTTAATTSTPMGGPAPYWASYSVDPSTGNRRDVVTHRLGVDGVTTGTDTETFQYPAAGATPGSSGSGSGGPHAVSSVSHSDGAATDTYAYDADGATTALPGHTVAYDGEELPTTQVIDGTTESDVYDAAGNLLLASDPSTGTTAFLGDTQLHASPSGVITGSRTYSLLGEPVAERDVDAGGTGTYVSFLETDLQGTPTAAVSDATTAVTRRYYDPYGVARGPVGTWPDRTAASAGNHAFRDDPEDALTASDAGTDTITQVGARQYDASLGRFLTVNETNDAEAAQTVDGYADAVGSTGDTVFRAGAPTALSAANDPDVGLSEATSTMPQMHDLPLA